MKHVSTYNPATFGSLSDEDKAAMQNLTAAEIADLAKAYPNTANGKTYIVLKDKNKKDSEQLFAPSTWHNLAELHRLGQKQWVAYGPAKGFKPTAVKTGPIQDLTNQEARQELASVSNVPEGEDFNALDDEQLKERFLVATGEEAGDKSREDIISVLQPVKVETAPVKTARTAPVKTAPVKAATKAAVKTAATKAATKKSR